MLARYRRTGAEPPFGDLGRAHGTGLEGYYWRLTDARAGRVVVVLCGVCRPPGGTWAVVGLAAHPGGLVRHACVTDVTTASDRFGVRAGSVLEGSAERLSLRLADDARVEVRLHRHSARAGRAFGALGLAHAIPGMRQYWHPVVLAGTAEGEARLGEAVWRLDGARGYAEKNWGAAFPERWWWGHAAAFRGVDATVAFAGGPMPIGPPATAVVVRIGNEAIRLVPPFALARAAVTPERWAIRARSPRWSVEVEGSPDGAAPHLLPVPDVGRREVRMRSVQHLAGRVALRVRRRGSLVVASESPLAGLELGLPGEPIG